MLLRGDETNPILHIEELPRFSWHRPQPVPGAVHVYLSRHDRVHQPAGGYTTCELWLLGPRRLYVVDVSGHHDARSIDVVSPGSGRRAALGLTYLWRVVDPRFVVAAHLVDVMPAIQDLLRELVTRTTAALSWNGPAQLATALGPDPFPRPLYRDGLEVSSLRAEVILEDGTVARSEEHD